MPSSYILVYLDLVGYSKNNEPIQVDLFRKFQKEIQRMILSEQVDSNAILIPTCDGIIVGIRIEDIYETYKQSFEIVCEVILWTTKNNCDVRSSIHVGDVNILKDVNRHDNIVGNTINDASRILTGANNGSIVISKSFFDKFLRSKDFQLMKEYQIDEKWSYALSDEDVILDKHSFEHKIYNMLLYRYSEPFGNNNKFLAKYSATIYSTNYPKSVSLKEKFIQRVINAKELDFIGIFHPSLPEILANLHIDNRTVHINIYYASDKLKDKLSDFFGELKGNLDPANRQNSIDAILNWHSDNPAIKLNIYEYHKILPFGASMVDKSYSSRGFIHVSHYLPCVLPSDTPYIEMEWLTTNKPPIYDYYISYFDRFTRNEFQEVRRIR